MQTGALSTKMKKEDRGAWGKIKLRVTASGKRKKPEDLSGPPATLPTSRQAKGGENI